MPITIVSIYQHGIYHTIYIHLRHVCCFNFRKHFNIQVCKTTTKKCQRNNTNKTEDEMSEGTVPGNERKADRDSYNDPWELRHNIVHMDELYQQEIIDNQMEETET